MTAVKEPNFRELLAFARETGVCPPEICWGTRSGRGDTDITF